MTELVQVGADLNRAQVLTESISPGDTLFIGGGAANVSPDCVLNAAQMSVGGNVLRPIGIR